MFKRNLIKQVGYKDCGPACLLMIIKHYKGNISLEKLKEMCKTNKNGTTAYDLIEASRECGFTAHGIKCKIEEFSSDSANCTISKDVSVGQLIAISIPKLELYVNETKFVAYAFCPSCD